MPNTPARLIDSHTGGEPTRLLVSGGPDLGLGSMAERLRQFRQHHEHWRRALVNEPRGNHVLVGAQLCEPVDPASASGVNIFKNVGYLGMCGHGTIGLVATLLHLGRLVAGQHRIETPVGTVQATLHGDGSVTVANVPAFRHTRQVAVDVPGHGRLHGDVAWGGNWFFLAHDHGLDVNMQNLEALTDFSWRLREQLTANRITGANGAEIDHIELFASATSISLREASPWDSTGPEADSKSFVLCPGKAYDRSPC
ncbi:MAG: proline racemase family protein, partial [Rubrivivax sp.]|nr:proline racemase family protein [Rubrivivax sp.]